MVMMVSRRRLPEGDFDAWTVRFEAQCEARAKAGCRGVRRFHAVNDKHELMVIFDWDTIENAKAFLNIKLTEKPELLDKRSGDTSAGLMLENRFMVEMEPLPS
ncbi:hypothetical protein EZH22_01950 [Xanthobacter dioxanivorans]|uniref:ABM domain-containing protein n=1 Tax=Xanthobacter dioxanivorans TaxID=2528964 RepID=A0A974PP85_9HYPH|nr:antibiotic biosynthesis monooxygenase [Xanthobacter dioxanivorans]QRG07227.1 hypothetical protein EZH22_01950 [Xanthobacter dioxanivorans]